MGWFEKWIGAAAFAALAAAPLGAQTSSPAPGSAADKDKKICKAETPTGSLVARKKVCKTRAQWDAELREAQDVTQKMQDPRVSCGSAPTGC